ncbi:MAG: OsmC family peroxiredoxin [Chryseobacterium sp.]|uniref:OsmC family protein n=1 Tax=Epilithonimonas caeni TaxID=365343 RepID=UPI000420D4D5|nr:OsmC family protein [Epilithonimonas caeni]MPS74764.1 OsmC family peroxiredoxin [Chryseobacterium sp.]
MTSKTTYLGESKIESVHEASGEVFSTYVPSNDFTVREHFSPTDIFATALAESVFASLVVLGKDRNIDITGATCELKKTMYFEPRRIGEIFCVFKFPHSYSTEEKEFIENSAKTSPVYLSLHPDIKKIFLFEYQN